MAEIYFQLLSLAVTVPEGPSQAKPGSDVLLPCYFEKSSGHIDLKSLAVIWSVGTRDIAKYEDKLEDFHPGAKMSSEGLQRGNASILLPNDQDADGTTYTCFVIYSPDSEKELIELRVEVPIFQKECPKVPTSGWGLSLQALEEMCTLRLLVSGRDACRFLL
uniref:Ig-like domain-containing protein n=1 Tax=Naja naja TaxID=35670 RepID=A0A8C6XCK6_NAJNA